MGENFNRSWMCAARWPRSKQSIHVAPAGKKFSNSRCGGEAASALKMFDVAGKGVYFHLVNRGANAGAIASRNAFKRPLRGSCENDAP